MHDYTLWNAFWLEGRQVTFHGLWVVSLFVPPLSNAFNNTLGWFPSCGCGWYNKTRSSGWESNWALWQWSRSATLEQCHVRQGSTCRVGSLIRPARSQYGANTWVKRKGSKKAAGCLLPSCATSAATTGFVIIPITPLLNCAGNNSCTVPHKAGWKLVAEASGATACF